MFDIFHCFYFFSKLLPSQRPTAGSSHCLTTEANIRAAILLPELCGRREQKLLLEMLLLLLLTHNRSGAAAAALEQRLKGSGHRLLLLLASHGGGQGQLLLLLLDQTGRTLLAQGQQCRLGELLKGKAMIKRS
jgi:hypothetical protein